MYVVWLFDVVSLDPDHEVQNLLAISTSKTMQDHTATSYPI